MFWREGLGSGKRNCVASYLQTRYKDADKPLARPTSRYIFFYGENISFDASFIMYINSTNLVLLYIYIYIQIVPIFLELWL
jgi:hypothetical protein